MELLVSRGGHLHGIELQLTFKRCTNYSPGDRLYINSQSCMHDFFALISLNVVIQEMGDGSVLLRLAHLYEVKRLDLVLDEFACIASILHRIFVSFQIVHVFYFNYQQFMVFLLND